MRAGQRGAALLTGLMFLVVLTLIGITAARMAGLEERMSGNMRDRALAMQAAEMTLRDAERDVINATTSRGAYQLAGITNFVADCGASTGTLLDNGLCYNGPGGYGTPIWTTVNMTAAPSVPYGSFTGAAAIAGVSAQPRYILEGIRKTPPGGGEAFFYRVTVRAVGANPNTVVWLQEVFKL
jgi:type IV pilus assembly protein PilX